jgi:Tfp pilus assembly protein PilO
MEMLDKLPLNFLVIAAVGYFGFQLYEFELAPSGAVARHEASKVAKTREIQTLTKKKEEAEVFISRLEEKRKELLALNDQLNNLQATLSEGLEVPTLIRLLSTEAANAGIKVEKTDLGTKKEKEFYIEQEFRLVTRGSFVQQVAFLNRISQLQRILRVEAFELVPKSPVSSKLVTLEGRFSIRAYQYAKSQVDELYRDVRRGGGG